MHDELSEEHIAQELSGAFGSPLRVLQTTSSTNDDAMEWAAQGAPEGAVVVADQQTAGRGRRGRSWWSEPGMGLLFSLVLRPSEPVASLGLLTTALGVACAQGIEVETGLSIGLKWPNDLMVDDRKLGGILVETRVDETRLEAVVAGVGINFHPPSSAPILSGGPQSTSLWVELAEGRPSVVWMPSRALVLAAILAEFEELYPALDPNAVLGEATVRSTILGHDVLITRADQTTITGRAEGLSSRGALVVLVGGKRIEVDSGDVARVRKEGP
jgi:BirA family transcriptional regulator, biotin operon repressor / biotin---[acetyl-CoA-carboxylase] ligase